MAITTEMVKELRERTGAGVLDCKKALEKAMGDVDKALALLREQGLATAAKKATRVAREGLIEAYVHSGAKVASLVELNSESDFVALTDEFKSLAHDLAMQVAAAKPLYVSVEDVPADVVAAKRGLYETEAATENRPAQERNAFVESALALFYEQVVLLEQPYIRDQSVRVRDLIARSIAKLGENIVVRRFARFAIGEEESPEESRE